MVSPCDNKLTEAGFDTNDVQFIKQLSKEGLSLNEISEKMMVEIQNKSFRKDMDLISQTRTESFLESLTTIAKSKNPYKNILNLLVGDKSGITSKSLSRSQRRASYLSAVMKMPNADIKHMLNNNDLARTVTNMQMKQVARINEFGGGVNWRNDYVTKQFHDSFRMLKAKKEKWVVDIEKYLDPIKTKAQIFYHLRQKGVVIDEKKFNMKNYLSKVFDKLTTKESSNGLVLDTLHVKRTLAFKDSKALMDYNSTYGHYNMANAIFENMTMIQPFIIWRSIWLWVS